MKRFLLALPVVVLIAAGCNSSPQVSSQMPVQNPVVQNTTPTQTTQPTAAGGSQTASPSPTPAKPLTASGVIQALTSTFMQQGYTIGTNIQPVYILPNFWWLDPSGVAVNLPDTNSLSFNLNTQVPGTQSGPVNNLPEPSKIIQTADSYFSANGFSAQANQSTGTTQNPNTDLSYTRAYLNQQTSVRCRMYIYTTDDGIAASYPYADSVICADSSDYAQAYSAQAPFLKGMTGGGTDAEGDLFIVELGTPPTCSGDPSIKLLKLDSANGSSAQEYAFKLVNGTWAEDNISGYQIDQDCK